MKNNTPKKALLKLNFSCNNRCVFCHAVDNAHYEGDETRFAVEKMKKAKNMGVQMIIFSGGESTIREDFFVLVKAAKTLGLKHGVITNGRMLSYKDFAEQYLSCFPEYVYVSLHGAKQSTHNRMVLAPAFEQVMAGLKNVAGKVPDLTVNAVLTKTNMRELREMVDLVLPFAPIRLKFSYTEPKGNARHQFEDVVPDISEAARYVNEAIAYGEEKGAHAGLRMGCENFVPCLIENYDRYNDDLFTDNFIVMSESDEEAFFPVDSGKRVFLPACHDCSLKSRCQGLFSGYVKRAGEQNIKIKPVREPVPAGFNFTACASFKKAAGDCPVAGLPVGGLDPHKTIFLLQGKSVEICKTETEQFSIQTIREMKRETQQVYLDVSDPGRSAGGFADFEDYKKNRIKLKLRRACGTCSHLAACPAAFERSDENTFGFVERRTKEILRELSGNILEAGCGKTLYGDILHELYNANKIQYMGVDPVPVSSNGFKTFRSTIEDFQWEPAYFDAALVLRSYSHFYDLKKAFDAIFRVMKPGGVILIVENGPSALLQTNGNGKQKGARAYEHYRNHTSYDALEFLRAHYSFSSLEHIPLSSAHENQWLLRISLKKENRGRVHFLLKEANIAKEV